MLPISNAKLKLLRALTSRKGRSAHSRFIAEGPRLVAEGLRAGWHPEVVAVCDALVPVGQREAVEAIARDGVSIEAAQFQSVADTVHGQGVLAVFAIPNVALDALVSRTPHTLIALDGVQDPGNAGTIWRSAAAFGADAMLFLPGSVDPYNAKVVRSSMGAVFTVPAPNTASLPETTTLVLSRGGTPVYDVDWPDRCALVVGSEASGPTRAWPDAMRIGIPQSDQVESLNAAVAASIVLAQRFGLRHRAAR